MVDVNRRGPAVSVWHKNKCQPLDQLCIYIIKQLALMMKFLATIYVHMSIEVRRNKRLQFLRPFEESWRELSLLLLKQFKLVATISHLVNGSHIRVEKLLRLPTLLITR